MSPQTLPGDVLRDVTRDVTAARQGYREALGRVLAHMRPYLLAVGKGRGREAGRLEAEDVVQEAIYNAVRAFGRFEGTTTDELRAWLRQILVNAIRDRHKFW